MRPHRHACIAAILLMAGIAWADPALVGTWEFTEDGETSRLVFKADGTADFDGAPMKYNADGGVLKLEMPGYEGMAIEARFRLEGDKLLLSMDEEIITYGRVGQAPAASSPVAAAPAAGNPLAMAQAPTNPAAGTWSNDALTLRLHGNPGALEGSLTVGGVEYPVKGRLETTRLYGQFIAEGITYLFEATIAGNRMTLLSDGETYELTKKVESPAPPANPLAQAQQGQGQAAGAPAGTGGAFSRPDSGFDIRMAGGFAPLKSQGLLTAFGSQTTPGLILVLESPSIDAAQIEEGTRSGYQDEELQLTPTGAARAMTAEGGGGGKVVDVTGTLQGSPVVGMLAGVTRGDGKGGLIVAALTTAESWPQLRPAAEETLKAIHFYAPQESDRLRAARQALSGHSLVYSHNLSTSSMNSSGYYTGTSTISFRAWHCCADGWARYEGARSASFQGGGIYGASENAPTAADGRWSLSSAGEDYLLTIAFDDGSSESWTVSVDANENVYVDGTKVKVTTDSICNR